MRHKNANYAISTLVNSYRNRNHIAHPCNKRSTNNKLDINMFIYIKKEK